MKAKMRARWEEYQKFMVFLNEYLPSITTRQKGRIVLRELIHRKDVDQEFYDYVRADYIESLVRRYLHLPTIQQSRRELDAAVREIREKANG